MLAVAQNFIPVLTSEAGLCLTASNWQECNVTVTSYSLEDLLYKPGLAMLNKITDIGHYLAWPGVIVLNAQSLKATREGVLVLKSPYDGSKIQLDFFELFALIKHLSPNALVLPKNIMQDFPQFWDYWDAAILPFFHVCDAEKQSISRSYGVYFNVEASQIHWEQFAQWSNRPRYAAGTLAPKLINELRAQGIRFIETDEPAQAAFHGQVYHRDGVLDLTDSETQMQFEPIDRACTCPTCNQGFSRAYLHHLFQHTPLLCQRFLIQHNVFYVQNVHGN